MFKLKITDLENALKLAPRWATYTISLLDSDYRWQLPQPSATALLRRYYFDDVSIARYYYDEVSTDGKSLFQLATHEQIQDILEFISPLQDHDKLLVHCHAGISRSTAVACGILCEHGLSPNEAVKHVLSIRPQASPNSHVINLFDQLLGLENQLNQAVEEEMDRLYTTFDLGLDAADELSSP